MANARVLFDNYQRLTPNLVRNAVPSWAKAAVLRELYQRTLHPDIAFLFARHLHRLQQNGQHWLRRRLSLPGFESVQDPFFSAAVTLDRRKGAARTFGNSAGRFTLEFGYFGLKIMARLPVKEQAIDDSMRVSILVDGHVLRSERLHVTDDGRWATLRYVIKRPALSLFPPEFSISVLTEGGIALENGSGGSAITVHLPTASGGIGQRLKATGALDKKGNLRPTIEELEKRQDRYLDLYERVRIAFEEEFGKPLFILYGTLLGQFRSGDFIPGDDDFDVGYVSEATSPDEVRIEAMSIIERLVARGFTVSVNREGKPFRVRDDESGAQVHLDNRPVFTLDDGQVWMHKQARLSLPLQTFRDVSTGLMRDREILRPRGTEEFLAAYYGENWRTPDPSFSNAASGIPVATSATLGKILLSRREQQELVERSAGLQGRFLSTALYPPYPIDAYASDIGW